MPDKLRDVEARRDAITERLAILTERDRELSRSIGAKVAAGAKSPQKMRDDRRDVRDELEDLVAALPVLDRESDAARTELEAGRTDAARSALAAVELECVTWGENLLDLLAPVVVHLETEGPLDTRYKDAQRTVHGTANGHLAETSGVGLRTLQKLRQIINEVAK